MNRNLLVIFICLVVIPSVSFGQQTREKLNVIIIHVDDLGWSDLGIYGSDYYQTPNIDQLAREGLRFTNSYAAASICSPTRAALLTGKAPARTGITDWIRARFQGGILPDDGSNPQGYDLNEGRALKTPENYLYMPSSEVTLAEMLKDEGYRTAHIGKWHLGPKPFFPEKQGFDVNIGGADLGQPPSYFDPYEPPYENKDYVIPSLEPRKEGEYLTDREGDEAVRFIRKNRKGKFFLHWTPYAVHTPIQAKDSLIRKYEKLEGTTQNNPVYAAMIESVDENVGKVMDALDELELNRHTLIIFSSDNGGLLAMYDDRQVTSNAPLRSGKGYPYEGGIRVPTIMKLPGVIPAGKVTDSPVITMEILPTVLSLVDRDEEMPNGLDGMDLAEVFRNPDTTFERNLFWHFPHYRGSDVVPYSIIRSGNYKLINYYDGSRYELYDLETDPGERVNLIDKKSRLAARLERKLDRWLEKVNARMPMAKSD